MKEYTVYLWRGCGYILDEFHTQAESDEQALERVVARIVNAGDAAFFVEESEVQRWADEDNADDLEDVANRYGFSYIDATMEGANRPAYLRIENAKIIAA